MLGGLREEKGTSLCCKGRGEDIRVELGLFSVFNQISYNSSTPCPAYNILLLFSQPRREHEAPPSMDEQGRWTWDPSTTSTSCWSCACCVQTACRRHWPTTQTSTWTCTTPWRTAWTWRRCCWMLDPTWGCCYCFPPAPPAPPWCQSHASGLPATLWMCCVEWLRLVLVSVTMIKVMMMRRRIINL